MVFALPLALACGSFAPATDDAPADAGAPTPPADAGGPFHCPSPEPPNGDCRDFEANGPIAGDTQSGTLTRVTGGPLEGSWMKASAGPLSTDAAWARIVEVVGAVVPTFELDARISVAAGFPSSIVDVHLERDAANRHELSITVDHGALALEVGTFLDGTIVTGTYAKTAIGTIPFDTWFRLHVRVRIAAVASPSATIDVDVGGTPRLVGAVSNIDPSLGATRTNASFGITYAEHPSATATALFDDVQMSWKVP